jgi:hypothetical protein
MKLRATMDEHEVWECMREAGHDTSNVPLTTCVEDGYSPTISRGSIEEIIKDVLGDLTDGHISILNYESQVYPLRVLLEYIDKSLKELGLTGYEEITIIT